MEKGGKDTFTPGFEFGSNFNDIKELQGMKKSLNGNTDTALNTVMRMDKHIRRTAQEVICLCGKSEHQKTDMVDLLTYASRIIRTEYRECLYRIKASCS